MTITNLNAFAVTGLAFTDAYPAGLVNAAVPGLVNTCAGAASAAAGGTQLTLSGGTVAAGSSCTVSVNVTSALAGSYNNGTGVVSTTVPRPSATRCASSRFSAKMPEGSRPPENGSSSNSSEASQMKALHRASFFF